MFTLLLPFLTRLDSTASDRAAAGETTWGPLPMGYFADLMGPLRIPLFFPRAVMSSSVVTEGRERKTAKAPQASEGERSGTLIQHEHHPHPHPT